MLPAICLDCVVPLAAPQVAERLAAQVMSLLHDEPKMHKFGIANRAKVDAEYGIDAVARLHLDLQARSMSLEPSNAIAGGGAR
jgi:hypothetical protein